MADRTQFGWLDRLPDATRQAIDYFSMRFESEWQAGRRPKIEGYLAALKDAAGRTGLLAELLQIELEFRRRAGEQATAAEYLQRFGEHADVIKQVLEQEESAPPTIAPPLIKPASEAVPLASPVSVAGVPSGESTNVKETPAGAGGRDLPATLMGGGAQSNPATSQVPGYEIVNVLGRGGMGIVYQAKQLGANRVVALKMILSGDFTNEQMRARFLVEGEMLGRLQHPNIVQIYDVGTHQDRPYLALEYVSGGTLGDRLDGRPMPPRDAARIVEQLARAIHHAHLHGVIHRDLKPGNILLAVVSGSSSVIREADGILDDRQLSTAHVHRPTDHGPLTTDNWHLTTIPKITDFGLARPLDTDARLTETGQVMGTPAYMSPEQARCDKQLGPPVDIYALGAILYELLTGQPPFRGESSMDTLLKVVNEEPQPPRRFNQRIPSDLEVICLKCLEKDASRRYGSAEQLADDLQRFLTGEPISARPVGYPERVWKWARRKPALAALSAAIIVLLAGGFIAISGSLLYALAGWSEADRQRGQVEQQRRQAEARRLDAEAAQKLAETRRRDAETARNQADAARKDADAARRRAETANYFSAIARTRLEWQFGNARGARATLDSCPLGLRGWEWYYLNRLDHADLWTSPGNPPYVFGLAFRPDGKVLASAGGGNPFWQTQGPASIRPGEVKLWDAATGKLTGIVPGHANIVTAVAFSKDGSLMADTSCDGLVNVWETDTGKRRFSLGESRLVGAYPRHEVVFSPDGKRLAALLPHQVTIWDPAGGKKVVELESFANNHAHGLAYSPDGQTLLTFHGNRVRFWDASSGKSLRAVPAGGGRGASLSPDGKLLALPSGRTVKVVDAGSGDLVQVLSGHAGNVLVARFSPDSTQLATGGDDHTVRLWNIATGTEQVVYRGHRGRVSCLAFHPDGQSLASADEQPGEVKLWDLTRHPETVLCGGAGEAQAIGFTADEGRLIAVSPKSIRFHDADTGKVAADLPFVMAAGNVIVPSRVADLSADSRMLVSVAPNQQSIQVWEFAHEGREPRLLRTLELTQKTNCVAISADGRHVAALLLNSPAEVKVWDTATGRPVSGLRGQPSLWGAIALSGDGRRLIFENAAIDLTSGKLLAAAAEQGGVTAVACSVDGRLAASADQTGRVLLWETATGKTVLPERLSGAGKGVFDLAFSPDNRLLAGVTREEVHVWELATGQEVLVLRGAPPRSADNAFNPRVAWSRDGRRLAAINHNGTISVWAGQGR